MIAGKVAAELAGILQEVVRGARLLYDGLPVHSLGEDQLCKAVNSCSPGPALHRRCRVSAPLSRLGR